MAHKKAENIDLSCYPIKSDLSCYTINNVTSYTGNNQYSYSSDWLKHKLKELKEYVDSRVNEDHKLNSDFLAKLSDIAKYAPDCKLLELDIRNLYELKLWLIMHKY